MLVPAVLRVRHEPVIAGSSAVGRSFRDGIFKLLRIPGIDSASPCSLAGRYNNPIPTRFLAPIDCSKIPTQTSKTGGDFNLLKGGYFYLKNEGQYDQVGFLPEIA
jgi:hypothetical protein